jgi:hypothetical protein
MMPQSSVTGHDETGDVRERLCPLAEGCECLHRTFAQ